MNDLSLTKSVLAAACVAGLAMSPMVLAADREDMREDAADAVEQLQEAREVLTEMRTDAELAAVLDNAHGVFVVPEYGRAALGVGVRGGEGVLLVRDGTANRPVLYDFGGASIGLQAGAEGGSIAMVLTSERALDSFVQKNNWSLNADAGLTVVDWSAKAQASAGKGDVIVWSDTKGLLGDLSVGITDIRFDEEETAAFYDTTTKDLTRQKIVIGVIKVPEGREIAGADDDAL